MSAERDYVLELLRRHGWNATSFQILEPAFRYWFDGPEACVAYADTGRAWVAAGAPIAAIEHIPSVCARFAAAASANGRRAAFFAVEPRFVERVPMPAIAVGEQPSWDPERWDETLRSSRSLREQVRRARAKKVLVRRLGTPEVSTPGAAARVGIEGLVRRWLSSRAMAPMGFLVAVHPFEFPDERRYFVAECCGRVVGFLAAVPVFARNGFLLEDLLRDPDAPNGTAELLVDAAMRALASEGCQFVTLGLAPLSGPVEGWLRVARRWSAPLYDFHGVRAFKAKFRPDRWTPIYLAHPPESGGVTAVVDVLTAFAHGSLSRFGIETVLRAPALVVRLLAVPLLVAGLLLAWGGADAFATATWIARGAGLVDIALAVALIALATRWRQHLATSIASLAAIDSLATLLWAIGPSGPPARAPLAWVVVALAWLGPTVAAGILWAARTERRRWVDEIGFPSSHGVLR